MILEKRQARATLIAKHRRFLMLVQPELLPAGITSEISGICGFAFFNLRKYFLEKNFKSLETKTYVKKIS